MVTLEVPDMRPPPLSPETQLSKTTSSTVSVVLWALMPPPHPVASVVCNRDSRDSGYDV
jgi:hypothetical protein